MQGFFLLFLDSSHQDEYFEWSYDSVLMGFKFWCFQDNVILRYLQQGLFDM